MTTLYISNNQIADWSELDKLAGMPNFRVHPHASRFTCPCLSRLFALVTLTRPQDILLVGNPIYEGLELADARIEVLRHLPNLSKIDGDLVKPAEREAAAS